MSQPKKRNKKLRVLFAVSRVLWCGMINSFLGWIPGDGEELLYEWRTKALSIP
jgi:hypothetical protein